MLHTDPPPFFHRGPSPLARFAFFAVLSIALLFADSRFRYLEGMRHGVNTVIAPLQRAVQWPGEAWEAVGVYFASKSALATENAALHERLLAEAPALQGAHRLESENAHLKSLLDIKDRYAGNAVSVGVMFTSRDPFSQKVFIDKGGDAGIEPGAAVIDEAGVVGQVTRVFASMAEVTLLTDKDHAVPVMSERTGVRSVLYGAGAGRSLELRFIPPSADIAAGDRLVTSGLDRTYPPGLAVARVDAVERDTGQIFARISCSPLAGVNRSGELLVLGRTAALPPRPDDPPTPDAARKPGRAKVRRGG
jgi:rod shape-determining protein MreC